MSQQILFKRSLTTFNSRAEAVTKFDSLTWNAGEPVIANYIDKDIATTESCATEIAYCEHCGQKNERIIDGTKIKTITRTRQIIKYLKRESNIWCEFESKNYLLSPKLSCNTEHIKK